MKGDEGQGCEEKCWKRVWRVMRAKDVEIGGTKGVRGDGSKGCEGRWRPRMWRVIGQRLWKGMGAKDVTERDPGKGCGEE